MNRSIALVFVAAALSFASLSARAAVLTEEVVQGTKKICIYSDGSTKTVSSAGICPRVS